MRILIPIDQSDHAHAALEHAIATYPDATLVALHVVDPTMTMYRGEMSYDYERLIDLEEKNADDLLEAAVGTAEEHDVSITTETLIGKPARAIVMFAEENDIDHIILGSRGKSGVSRVLLGSVAEQVMRRAPCPVTVVR
jgi:nucleotide-binding universal stress UspA family protein